MVIAVALVPGLFGPLLLKPCEEKPSKSVAGDSHAAIRFSYFNSSRMGFVLRSCFTKSLMPTLSTGAQADKGSQVAGQRGVLRLEVREHVSVKTRNSQHEMVTVY